MKKIYLTLALALGLSNAYAMGDSDKPLGVTIKMSSSSTINGVAKSTTFSSEDYTSLGGMSKGLSIVGAGQDALKRGEKALSQGANLMAGLPLDRRLEAAMAADAAAKKKIIEDKMNSVPTTPYVRAPKMTFPPASTTESKGSGS